MFLQKILINLVLIGHAFAGEAVDLYIPNIPPLSAHSDEEGSNIAIAPVLDACDFVGRKKNVVYAPWARAQQIVSTGKNLLIAPLGRTKERESKFTWIAPIMNLKNAFLSLDRTRNEFLRRTTSLSKSWCRTRHSASRNTHKIGFS